MGNTASGSSHHPGGQQVGGQGVVQHHHHEAERETQFLASDLPRYIIESKLPTRSGRMFRGYRVRSNEQYGVLMICKVAVFKTKSLALLKDDLAQQQKELARILEAVGDSDTHPHILPYQRWIVSENSTTVLRSSFTLQPVYLLRQHCFATLADRLATRPFLTKVEKKWIAYQILRALQSIHDSGVCHGNLTTDNICVTSWNWVVLTDFSSHIKPTLLPYDDPSDFIYYFQKSSTHGGVDDTSKRCYLAPERFYNTRQQTTTTTTTTTDTPATNATLTPAMDIFSAGCVLIETMLNDGERTCELGDVMEYLSTQTLPNALQRKLNKIESSSFRAACKHMLSYSANERKTAATYLNRLRETDVFPSCFATFLWPFVKRLRNEFVSPDARIAYAAASYTEALEYTTTYSSTTNAGDEEPNKNSTSSCVNHLDDHYFELLVGNTAMEIMKGEQFKQKLQDKTRHSNNTASEVTSMDKKDNQQTTQFHNLLDNLESLELASSSPTNIIDDGEKGPKSSSADLLDGNITSFDRPEITTSSISPEETPTTSRNVAQQASDTLLIYLQVVLAPLRHVQRPSSKLVALEIIERSSKFLTDDARLQRIVPNVVSLLDDPNAVIRARSIRVLANVLSLLQGFSPSDSLLFPQYIFKRISHLVHDDQLIVRMAFAESIALLAETAQRFLDVTHAARLYEAVGGSIATHTEGGSGTSSSSNSTTKQTPISHFSEDLAKLLDKKDEGNKTHASSGGRVVQPAVVSTLPATEIMIPNTYDAELAALHETVSGWIVQLATDSSDHSSFLKRALLSDLARLCAFFGRDGVTSQILPQILAFLNNRTDWQLRAALSRNLPSACAIVGRVATEHFVVPCVETAIFDVEEQVTTTALVCLSSLVTLGLLTRTTLFGYHSTDGSDYNFSAQSPSFGRQKIVSNGLLEKYAPLLLHPSKGVRRGIQTLIAATCKSIGSPDDCIFVLPLLRPYLRYEPSSNQLCSEDELEKCILEPISARTFDSEMERLIKSKSVSNSLEDRGSPLADNDWTTLYKGNNKILLPGALAERDILIQTGNDVAVECSVFAASDANASTQYSSPFQQQLENETLFSSSRKASTSNSTCNSDNLSSKDIDETERLTSMESYLLMASNYRQQVAQRNLSPVAFEDISIPNSSAAYSFLFPNQKFAELISDSIPQWFDELREASRVEGSLCPETSSFRSLTSFAQTYGIGITVPTNSSQMSRKWKGDPTFSLDDITFESITMLGPQVDTKERQQVLLSSKDSKLMTSALEGEWGSSAELDPSFVDLSLLVDKVRCLNIPPLPPRLGVLTDASGRPFSWHGPVASSSDTTADLAARSEWKPRLDSVVVSSSTKTEHTAAVTRLAISQDQKFFVSASYDGTSRVWNLNQVQECTKLKSSFTYSGHQIDRLSASGVKINDVCVIENSHSVATCSNSGAVHIWRVDISSTGKNGVSAQMTAAASESRQSNESYRVSGASMIRRIDYQKKGEIIAVSHFNTGSSSVVAFATEKGNILSWDLRCAAEPFRFEIRPELGYLTTLSTLFDRNCFVCGTSRGYLNLLDIRYQMSVKIWRHSSYSPISRLATCYTTLPQDKDGKTDFGNEPRPYIFMGCGKNEASVFDLSTSSCRQCFRVLDSDLCYIDQSALPSECISMPELNDIPMPKNPDRLIASAASSASNHLFGNSNIYRDPKIVSLMGRLGMSGHQYLITGGTDRCLRYWDFSSSSKCYTFSGSIRDQPHPIYQKVDVGLSNQLFICRQVPVPSVGEVDSVKLPWKLQRGIIRPENNHMDSILDVKSVEFPTKGLLSCSNDGMIKLWR